MLQRTLAFAASALLLLVPRAALAADAGAPVVDWDGGAAVVGGSACSNGVDAFVLANGNDLSLVFSNLGVALDENTPSSGQATCAVQVPAEVPAFMYPATVRHAYDYGVNRTAGTTGSLAMAMKFMTITVAPLGITAGPSGTHLLVSREDAFDNQTPWFAKWCSPARPTTGTLQVQFRAQATTSGANETIVLFKGLGLKYDLSTTWRSCN